MVDRAALRRMIVAAVVIAIGVTLTIAVALLAPSARGAEPDTGTARGTVTITGIRPDLAVVRDVMLCPAGQPFRFGCDGRFFSPTDGDGSYSVEVPPGQWQIAGAYREIHRSGPPPVIGDPVMVTIEAGRATIQDLVVTFRPSGVVEGTLTVVGLPPDAHANFGVFACRPDVTLQPFCANGGSDLFFEERYSLSLLVGDWRIVPAYNFENNDVFGEPVDFHLDNGEALELDLEVAFDPTLPPAPPPRPIPSLPPNLPTNLVCDAIVNGVFTSVPCGEELLPPIDRSPPPAAPPAAAVAGSPRFTG